MGLFGSIENKVDDLGFKWYVGRAWRDGLAGKKGKDMQDALKKVQGLRTAIMAIVLLAEVILNATGHAGVAPLHYVHLAFAAIGWDESTVKTIGFDPTLVGTSLVTVYFAARRLEAHVKTTLAAPVPATP